MSDLGLHPTAAGRESLQRVHRLVEGLDGELGQQASSLLARHGYSLDSPGPGPHENVLGHPLFDLPIWVAHATERPEDPAIVLNICESSLWGYLSVRAEDDFFDGGWDDPGAAMVLSTLFRTRHLSLLAPLVSDPRFWDRLGEVWRAYGEAMLLERALHDPGRDYGPEEFERVLQRSQPLEIPAMAVLAISDRWDLSGSITEMVRHLAKATQLFDDLVDAPDDLAAGNYTWMVRRLGGLEGLDRLKRGLIAEFDLVVSEAVLELEAAVATGTALGLIEMPSWVMARQESMNRSAQTLYQALLGGLGS